MSSIMDEKITNDPIHGIINLHPILIKIIDTPQFQRLRNIKQLGGCYFVYPGASHNRFEHSIGVCHLAGKLARQLKSRIDDDIAQCEKKDENFVKRLKSIKMTDTDVLCIEIAGLCHDIGHGPYSHLFDRLFGAEIEKLHLGKQWKHEDVSKKMVEHMIERNQELNKDLDEIFETEKENKVEFILSLIDGKAPENEKPERQFMYQIVANSDSGIDVDKMDYFARDCHGLGMKSSFDHNRYISQCRVMFVNGKSTIAVRDKEIFNLYELFHTRIGLFRRAYYHKVTKAVEIMLTEALVKANEVYEIKGKDSTKWKLSNAFEDMYAYEQLTDCVFENILNEKDKFRGASELISRIYQRDLYKMVHETQPKEKLPVTYSAPVLTKMIKDMSKEPDKLTDEDFVVEEFGFDYGKKDKNPKEEENPKKEENPTKEENPILCVYFYEKGKTVCYRDIKPEEVSLFLPSKIFQEKIVRVYAKKGEKEEKIKALARRCIEEAEKAIQEEIKIP